MPRFDKATYLSLSFKFILSERLSNNLGTSDVLLFSELINILPFRFITLLNSLYLPYIVYIYLLHTKFFCLIFS